MSLFKPLLILAVFSLTSILIPVKAQITLSPSFVFLNSKSGVGDLYVSNSSDKAYEITISFAFGYPDGDSLGNLVMNYNDPDAYEQFALDSMIRAFPREFILAGGEQRTVRIQVVPGHRKKEGFFFTRLKVMAKPQTAEITTQLDENVATQISFNFEQINAVFYFNGNVTTGVEVDKLEVTQAGDVLQLKPYLLRTGNAPFIGTMYARLKDKTGKTLAEANSTTSAYFDVIRAMDLKISGVAPGTYSLELSFETRRKDIKEKNLVQAPKVVFEQEVVVR
jgi:hypothetical protein